MPSFTVEMGDDKNRSFIFLPTTITMRGAYYRHNNSPLSFGDNPMANMPDIPGERITVTYEKDGTTASAITFDPLSRDEKLLERVNQVHKAAFGKGISPVPSRSYELDQLDFNTWVWHIARLVEKGDARVVEGTIPELKDGSEVKNNQFDFTAKAVKKIRINSKSRPQAKQPAAA